MSKLTHINENGDAEMVDVSEKDITAREAKASSRIFNTISVGSIHVEKIIFQNSK